jgi:hypothetical protein
MDPNVAFEYAGAREVHDEASQQITRRQYDSYSHDGDTDIEKVIIHRYAHTSQLFDPEIALFAIATLDTQ